MKGAEESARFTTRGQIVIPAPLRRAFHIEDGTRVVVQATAEGILLKPVTKHSVARLRGILRRRDGEPTLAEEWAEHKKAERALEESKHEPKRGRSR